MVRVIGVFGQGQEEKKAGLCGLVGKVGLFQCFNLTPRALPIYRYSVCAGAMKPVDCPPTASDKPHMQNIILAGDLLHSLFRTEAMCSHLAPGPGDGLLLSQGKNKHQTSNNKPLTPK